MSRIDIFNHVMPSAYLEALKQHSRDPGIVRRMTSLRMLWDRPIFERATRAHGVAIWMHPFRPGSRADYLDEAASKYEVWQVLRSRAASPWHAWCSRDSSSVSPASASSRIIAVA